MGKLHLIVKTVSGKSFKVALKEGNNLITLTEQSQIEILNSENQPIKVLNMAQQDNNLVIEVAQNTALVLENYYLYPQTTISYVDDANQLIPLTTPEYRNPVLAEEVENDDKATIIPWIIGGALVTGAGVALGAGKKGGDNPSSEPVNQAPTDLMLSTSNVKENMAGAVIGKLQVTDPDSNDTFSYTVNDERFEVVDGNLKLKEDISLDYEAAANLELKVTASDKAGATIEKTFTINVENVNEVIVDNDRTLGVGKKGGDNSSSEPVNQAPTDLILSTSNVKENMAGAVIGKLQVTDPDSNDTFSYTVNDERFEVVDGNLKLKEDISLDYEAAANFEIKVTASDKAGATIEKAFMINVENVDEVIVDNDEIVRLKPGIINDIKTGNGSDTLVIIGKTSKEQFIESDISNVLGRNIDLSSKVNLNEINNSLTSEVKSGDSINLGVGIDKVVIYGDVDLSGVKLNSVSQILTMGELTITTELLSNLSIYSLIGDGTSILNIKNSGTEPEVVYFNFLDLSGFNAIHIDKNVTVVLDRKDILGVKYIGGEGSIQASEDSKHLDLSGKIISVTVKDYLGNEVIPSEHKAFVTVDGILSVSGNLDSSVIGTENNDRLISKDGNDHLSGGKGDDILLSGKGNDILDGEDGNDKFVIFGDISSGGKIDNELDNFIVGKSLSSLNGIKFDDLKDSNKVINGGNGEDTLYVIGKADLSKVELNSIESIEIRSDVTFNIDSLSGIKEIRGDGSSILRFISNNDRTINLNEYRISKVQQLDVSEEVTIIINDIRDLNGITNLSGSGKIIIKNNNSYLDSKFTIESSLKVVHQDGSSAIKDARIFDNSVENSDESDSERIGDRNYLGTDGNDIIRASETNDKIYTRNGDDTLIGKGGDDHYIINGSGNKYILDSEGNDTLDFSKLEKSGAIVADLSINHIVASSVKDEEVRVKFLTGGEATEKQPLDLIIMQDLSGSFSDDVRTVSGLLDSLGTKIIEKNPNTWFGAASFVDKPKYGDEKDYVYKTDSKLSSDIENLKKAFNNMSVLSGGDTPESQLEALYQLALRTIKDDLTPLTNDGEIDFRPNSQRFVILTTDAPYHKAGDLSTVGPNNGDTILDGVPAGSGEDYPTIEAVKQALVKANIIPIFAVTSDNINTYKTLVNELDRGSVVTLSSDSSDLINAISGGLENYKFDYIENITGTKFDDSITGNNLDNTLNGNQGNDTLVGLGGNDTFIGGEGEDIVKFLGLKSDYQISVLNNNKLLIKGIQNEGLKDGVDIIDKTIEYLEFNDGEKIKVGDYFEDIEPVKGYKELFSAWKGGYLDLMLTLSSSVYTKKSIHDQYSVGGSTDGMAIESYNRLLEHKKDLIPLDLNLGKSISTYREGNVQKGEKKSFKYVYTVNSHDDSYLAGDYISVSSEINNAVISSSVAQAYKTSKGDAIFVSFRGTSKTSDWVDNIWDMSGHYQRYKPFIDSIKEYLSLHPEVEKVFVTGHSLGGEMAKFFMNEFKGDDKFSSVIFEAANKYVVGQDLSFDDRIISIEMEGDPVPDLTLVNLGKTLHIYDDEEDRIISIHNHMITAVQKQLTKIIDKLHETNLVNKNTGLNNLANEIFFVPNGGSDNSTNSNNITLGKHLVYSLVNAASTMIVGKLAIKMILGKLTLELSPIPNPILHSKLIELGFEESSDNTFKMILPLYKNPLSIISELSEGISSIFSASIPGITQIYDLLKMGYQAKPIFMDNSYYGKAMVYKPTVLLEPTIKPIDKNIDVAILDKEFFIKDWFNISPIRLDGSLLNDRDVSKPIYLIGNNAKNILVANNEGSILISGGDNDLLIGGKGNDVLYSGNIKHFKGYSESNPIHKLVEHYQGSDDDSDVSFLFGGKGNDKLYGNKDNDFFFIDVNSGIGSSSYSNESNVDNIYSFKTENNFFPDTAEDYLVFSEEQLGFNFNDIKNKTDRLGGVNEISEDISVSKFKGYHWFDEYDGKGWFDKDLPAFYKVNNISDYKETPVRDVSDIHKLPVFILEKSTGNLYFDQTGPAKGNDQILVARIQETEGSLDKFASSQIIIVPNFDMFNSYQLI